MSAPGGRARILPVMSLRSPINADVPVAAPGEFAPLPLGERPSVWPPVVLAPMAGVTNPPYRRLCRGMGAGLYVAEMVHARGLTERNAGSLRIASFADDEPVRSIQIFGSVPREMGEAARFLVEEVGVDHIDINMGCPVRKVTSRGGGSALCARPALMAAVIRETVRGAGDVPVTVKVRMGLDDELVTWPDALAAASEEGARWIGLHARTAKALYSGHARWDAIARMKERASIPVLGNGDVWEAFDALRMMRRTGCDGVIIGRGCLGRPWLFRELAQAFDGEEPDDPPRLGEVLALLRAHGELLVDFFGERKGVYELRKWCAWYTKGFSGAATARRALQEITTLAQLDALLEGFDPDAEFPVSALRVSRAKRGGRQPRVSLPHGWLEAAARERGADARAGDATPATARAYAETAATRVARSGG